MLVHLAKYEPDRLGGGWTFMRNLSKGLLTSSFEVADIYFISGATMVTREEVETARNAGKKIVLRVDNAIRNSRNRNTGMSRLKDFSAWADLVIYQSSWARDYLMPFTGKDGPVILNGCDLDLFTPEEKIADSIIYSRYNRDETKNWEVARYFLSQTKDKQIYIVGNFSPELIEGNFDFYQNEQFEYFGVLNERNYAKLLRKTEQFLYTYYNDACSNSLIEALCCACEIVGDRYYRETGGAKEIIESFESKGRDYFSLERMVGEYQRELSKV